MPRWRGRGSRACWPRCPWERKGLATLRNTSQWAVVGDLAYYLARGRLSNELHGLGAFLVMYEQHRARSWR